MSDILKDPDGAPYPEEVQALYAAINQGCVHVGDCTCRYLLDLLEVALEAVRTIEHIDMGKPENILFFEGRSPALLDLIGELRAAAMHAPWVRIAVDHGLLKVKAGEGSWSPGIATERPNGGYAQAGGGS